MHILGPLLTLCQFVIRSYNIVRTFSRRCWPMGNVESASAVRRYQNMILQTKSRQLHILCGRFVCSKTRGPCISGRIEVLKDYTSSSIFGVRRNLWWCSGKELVLLWLIFINADFHICEMAANWCFIASWFYTDSFRSLWCQLFTSECLNQLGQWLAHERFQMLLLLEIRHCTLNFQDFLKPHEVILILFKLYWHLVFVQCSYAVWVRTSRKLTI